MRDPLTSRLTKRTNVLLFIVLVLAVGISYSVYHSVDQIKQYSSQIVQTDLPTDSLLQRLTLELLEQERVLYEYQSTGENSLYQIGFLNAFKQANEIITNLHDHYGDIDAIQNLITNQQSISNIAQRLHDEVIQGAVNNSELIQQRVMDNAKLMRNSLQAVSHLRELNIIQLSHSRTLVSSKLNQIIAIVFILATAFFIVTFVVVKGVKAFSNSSAISNRLSLFTKRTPNPIISLDIKNQVTYSNSATKRLLKDLGKKVTQVELLLAEDLERHQQDVLKANRNFKKFDYQIGTIAIRCELHWLSDIKQWDLHLTDITAQKLAEQKLTIQAYVHPETGLANQYRFREVLDETCSKGTAFTLGIVEIRSYSQLISGRSIQKTLLIISEIAAVLNKACHDELEEIQLFHIGDKNFAIFIPFGDCSETVQKVVNHIHQQIQLTQFTGGHQVNLDFGFACFPIHANSTEALINCARLALEKSARDEHIQYVVYCEKLGQDFSRQQDIIAALRKSFSDNSFQLYFQPQYSLSEKTITGAEVLLRWQNKQEWISPSEFIPLAERTGLIIPLGEWILDSACEKGQQLVSMGFEDLVIAVNISPKQFAAPNFIDKVESALKKSGLPAANLELEITEGVLFNSEVGSIQNMHKLKALGVLLAIDDFGTGYSSLSYLKQLPIDRLKIDQSFIRDMHTDEADQSIVRSIIDLGNNLKMSVIAEGVEQQEHIDLLDSMGCQHIQGYWYSKPLEEGYFSYFLQEKFSSHAGH